MTSIISIVSHAKKQRKTKFRVRITTTNTGVNIFVKNTYRNMTTISVLLATSSSGASESRNTCNASL